MRKSNLRIMNLIWRGEIEANIQDNGGRGRMLRAVSLSPEICLSANNVAGTDDDADKISLLCRRDNGTGEQV